MKGIESNLRGLDSPGPFWRQVGLAIDTTSWEKQEQSLGVSHALSTSEWSTDSVLPSILISLHPSRFSLFSSVTVG